jgi:Flp pilus assembly protein TadD
MHIQYIQTRPRALLLAARMTLRALLTAVWLLASGAAMAQAPAASAPPTEREEIARLVREKQLDAALARADAFLAKSPRDAQIRFLRGVILADQGKAAEAIAVFESLVQDFPELPEPYNNLAVLLAAQGRYEQARTLLQQAVTAQPNYVTAYENLGDLYVALAADAYQRGAKLAPNDASLARKLALAREIGNKLRAAR